MNYPGYSESLAYQRVNRKRLVDLLNVVTAWCKILLF